METNHELFELGKVYQSKNMFYQAITECYIKILHSDKNNIVVLNDIGICYFNLSEYKLAIHYFKKVIKIKEIPDVFNNLSNCYVNIKEYSNAEKTLLQSYKLDKKNNKTHSSLGQIYYFMKKYNESIVSYKKIHPFTSVDKYNLSFSYLSKKDFDTGFSFYEKRLDFNNGNAQTKLKDRIEIPGIKYWNNETDCRSLLIVYEQGIGDNIQFFRFILELSEKYPNMKIDYFCKNNISHIFKTSGNVSIVSNVILKDYDYYIFVMSLPKILKITNILPNKINYIRTNNEKYIHWNNILSPFKKKVGFVYNGLLTSFIEKFIPLSEFESFTELVGIDFICLHKKDDIEKDIHISGNAIKNKNIHFFDIDIDSPFEDTICILQNLDLLITIDTYIVHLAGIMNIKTWLLLGKYSEWRWSDDNDKTYWYDSVELMRINEDIELKNILKNVKDKLLVWNS